MKKNARIPEAFQIKIKKNSKAIENLGIANESAKKQIIAILKENHGGDFIAVAEHYLELLLHTEKIIAVLRHDLSEFSSVADWNIPAENLEPFLERFQVIEQDILKTSKVVEKVKIAIANH